MQPSFDLAWELVRLANRDQVVAVFVSGKMRLWRGWPVDWDARALMQQVRTLAHAVVAQAPIQRIHSHSTEHRSQVRDRK
jgi:5-methylthioadenosine/S-adenosylhomocysteine deaminase